eukprot:CAMPEP_0113859172 /NCGR_PEP_ID=MMETSP0372-20130328/12019_1 /TAXON_ID=340204 /ORGANISM="Lankesteria abbotti" /LENGTH=192 /DNA_ID=CAMNT_0000837005 /DNA_START=48 /DNA_END=627 /DNA_ORIENTATION=+ /assembly_acc=CAM_ASM_000359
MEEGLTGVLEKHLTRALESKEAELDEKLRLYESLEEDDKRMERMKQKASNEQQLRGMGHGTYVELTSEKEFFEAAKKSKFMAVHFYRPTTWRCEILDKHLQNISQNHVSLRCVKINVEKAPFLAERLRIIVIPTLMLVKNGKTEHSVIGFDEFGGKDDFPTSAVSNVLRTHGMLRGNKENNEDDDDSDDSDC